MLTSTNHSTLGGKAQRVALAAAVMVASAATVAAKDYRPSGAPHYDPTLLEHRSVSAGAARGGADLPSLGKVGRGNLPYRPVQPEGLGNVAD